MKTKVKARVFVRGGFKSPRGQYSGEHAQEELFEGDLRTTFDGIDQVGRVLRTAESKLVYDEVIVSRKVEMTEVE